MDRPHLRDHLDRQEIALIEFLALRRLPPPPIEISGLAELPAAVERL